MKPFLEKNSNDMATEVETYLVEETVDLIYDNEKLTRWNDLVAELGLTGQNTIRKTDKSPIPFLSMNDVIKATFETLCPSKVEITEYSATSIPLEILDLVKLSNNEEYFGGIEIWYDEKQKDPLCVGYSASWLVDNKDGNKIESYGTFKTKKLCEEFISANNLTDCNPYNYSYQKKYWLIGRWSDMKQTLSELKAKAKERFVFEHKNSLLKEIKDKQKEMDDLELTANTTFGI